MKTIDDIRRTVDALLEDGRFQPPVQIMEICGTHTMSISQSGMRTLLGEGLRLVSGPGCPVCVTDQSMIDAVVALALDRPDVTIATYGDMVRVPGTQGSLAEARAKGADVRVVYGAQQAIELAAEQPDREVVFLGIGFETTAPATAHAVRDAKTKRLGNFSVLAALKLIPPAMETLLADPEVRIDGFLCPGHVSVILGWEVYGPIARRFHKPCVVAGFEPPNIAEGVLAVLRQLEKGEARAQNVYPVVSARGNETAKALLDEVFNVCDARWRGLGAIPKSGLALKDAYAGLDAVRRFDVTFQDVPEPVGCRCGEVITGRCLPTECTLFGGACTPNDPVGPCMVSSEGSCAAYFKYHRPM